MASQVVFSLYSMVDGLMVSIGVNEYAMSAVNLAIPFTNALFSIAVLFAVGSSTLIAIFIAQEKRREANALFSQNFATLLEMLNTMQVSEEDEDYQNPVDLLFEDLAKKKPNSFAGRQYKLYKLAAGVVCSKRLLNQMIWKSLRTHNFTYRRKETKP